MKTRTWYSNGGLVAAAIFLTLVFVAPAEGAACELYQGPDYSVDICLNTPTSGVAVSGDVPVAATIAITGNDPKVAKVLFYLDDEYLLTDYEEPYEFVLPTDTMVDGAATLSVEAVLRDDAITTRAMVDLTFANGNQTEPPVPTGFVPRTGTTPAPGEPFRILATGDGASGQTTSDQVVDLMVAEQPNLVLYLGDVYDRGTYTEFKNWYGENERYGLLADITNPVLGNHERSGNDWTGYDRYWQTPDPYYTFDVGGWHFIALNVSSNGGADGAQLTWLANELATNTTACTAALFHYPVVSLGPIGSTPALYDMWAQLVDAGVDLVLTGHEHNYQRWLPLDRNLAVDPGGVTHFVLGGGGHGIRPFGATDPRVATGLDSVDTAYGALDLRLNSDGAYYQYLGIGGEIRDSGTTQCSGTPTDTTAPSPPANVAAAADDHTSVLLTWDPANDNVGVSGYEVLRDGQILTTVSGSVLEFVDAAVTPSTTYTYTVVALDAAGNSSAPSDLIVFTVPAPSSSFVIPVIADAWVDSSAPSVNLGGTVDMSIDNSPDRRGYVRFDVAGVTGSVVSATLRVFADSSHSAGFEVRSVADQNWNETSITYDNAPAFGAVDGQSGPTVAGAYVDVDVSGAVTGNGSVTFALTPINSTNLRLAARESGNGAELIINQTVGGNGPPTAEPASASTVSDTPVDITLTATDPEGACPISFDIVTAPSAGSVGTPTAETCDAGNATATVTYTPDSGYTGSDQFEFSTTDPGNVTSAPAAVSIVIDRPSSDLTFTPVADSYTDAGFTSRNYGTSNQIRIDRSPERTGYFKFVVSGLAGPVTSATVRIHALSNHSAGYELAVVEDNSWTESGITFDNAPIAGAVVASTGPISSGTYVDVDVSDLINGEGTYSFAAVALNDTNLRLASRESGTPPELAITQSTAQNAAPSAQDVFSNTDEDQASVWSPVVSDGDGDQLTCTIATGPTSGTASVQPDCSSGGYIPDPDANGADSFTYRVSDGIESATATVSVVVNPVNDAPTADPWNVTAAQDATTDLVVSGHDVDTDCSLTLSVTVAPTHGDLGPIAGQTCSSGDVSATIAYTPNVGYTGADSFAYSITDSTGLVSNEAVVDISVNGPPEFVFAVTDDTYADAKFSTSTNGSSNSMQVDGSPERIGYLKFDVAGLPGTVVDATLRIYAQSRSNSGFAVAGVGDNQWNEPTLTYDNRPPHGSQIATSGPLAGNVWIEIPVSGFVTGEGTVSFALVPTDNTSIRLGTKENGFAAELVIGI